MVLIGTNKYHGAVVLVGCSCCQIVHSQAVNQELNSRRCPVSRKKYHVQGGFARNLCVRTLGNNLARLGKKCRALGTSQTCIGVRVPFLLMLLKNEGGVRGESFEPVLLKPYSCTTHHIGGGIHRKCIARCWSRAGSMQSDRNKRAAPP